MKLWSLILLLSFLGTTPLLAAEVCQLPGQSGRSPASSNPCDTAGELMKLNISGKQFTDLCQKIVASDPACQKIQPDKRLSCSSKGSNNILNTNNFGSKVLQCVKGFLWDSMVELGKFVWEIIKIAAGAAVDNVYKFITDSSYRQKALNAPSKTGALAKSFLRTSGAYFNRELPRNMAKCYGNPMCALGTTLAEPLTKFVSEAVESMVKELVPQYQCMNGAAKLNTICRLAGELVLPPVFLVSFLKHGIYGVRILAKSRTAARFNVRFAQLNEVRTQRNVTRAAANQAKTKRKVEKRSAELERTQQRGGIVAAVRTPRREKKKAKAVGKDDLAQERLARAQRADQAAFLQTEKAKAHLAELQGRATAAEKRTGGNIAAANDNELSDIARYEKARAEAHNQTQLDKARAILAGVTEETKKMAAATTTAVRNAPQATLNVIQNAPTTIRNAPRVTLNAMASTGKFVVRDMGVRTPVSLWSSQLPERPASPQNGEDNILDPLAGLSQEEIDALAAEYDETFGELPQEGYEVGGGGDYGSFLDVGQFGIDGPSAVSSGASEELGAQVGEEVSLVEEDDSSAEEIQDEESVSPPQPKYHGFLYEEEAPEEPVAATGPMAHIRDEKMRKGMEAAYAQVLDEDYLDDYRAKLQQDTLKYMRSSENAELVASANKGELSEEAMAAVIKKRMQDRIGPSHESPDQLLRKDIIWEALIQSSGKKSSEIESFLKTEEGKEAWRNLFGDEE